MTRGQACATAPGNRAPHLSREARLRPDNALVAGRDGLYPPRSGRQIRFPRDWAYILFLVALAACPFWFLVGVWRLVRWPECRRKLFGWLWLVFMCANQVVFVAALRGHLRPSTFCAWAVIRSLRTSSMKFVTAARS
jgi:hypothetical protein